MKSSTALQPNDLYGSPVTDTAQTLSFFCEIVFEYEQKMLVLYSHHIGRTTESHEGYKYTS